MEAVTSLTAAIDDITAYGPARSTVSGTPLDADEARKIHAFWRACNYRRWG
jgi:xylulose-5-phosphate/fructose-6-phosphate phosphoketolase